MATQACIGDRLRLVASATKPRCIGQCLQLTAMGCDGLPIEEMYFFRIASAYQNPTPIVSQHSAQKAVLNL